MFRYTIELTHGKFVWTVARRYKEFSNLSNRLLAHRAIEKIKAPVRRARGKVEDALDGDQEKVYDDANKQYEVFFKSEYDSNLHLQLQILSKIKDMSDFGLTNVNNTFESKDESKK